MHIPVMRDEAIDALEVCQGGWYLDGTFGRGGHTRAILEQGGNVVAFDLDHDAIEYGREALAKEIDSERFRLIQGNFAQVSDLLHAVDINEPFFDGALFDLGMSSTQLEESGRGFSFQKNEPLDMRMSTDLGVTAADLVNALPESHLKSLFWDYAQETAASAVARAIVNRRKIKQFRHTQDLADVVRTVKHGYHGHLHPATKVFMALRMAVNMELDNLALMLDQMPAWLKPSARLAIISFHEGEDRIVKQRLRSWEQAHKGVQDTKKPMVPTEAEVKDNPRARSAKLRVFVWN